MNKDIQPGKWDTAVGGHVDYGESIFEALCREAREELGIMITEKEDVKYLFSYIFESEIEKEMVNTFSLIFDGEIKPDKSEIDFGRFWDIEDVNLNIGNNIFTPNFENEFKSLKV